MGIIKKTKDSATVCYYLNLKHLPQAPMFAHLVPKMISLVYEGDIWKTYEGDIWKTHGETA